jgi:hypothetical protein
VHQQRAAVDEVERVGRKVIGQHVVTKHLDAGSSRLVEQARVEIRRHHSALGADPIREPGRNRAPARSHLQRPPSGRDAHALEPLGRGGSKSSSSSDSHSSRLCHTAVLIRPPSASYVGLAGSKLNDRTGSPMVRWSFTPCLRGRSGKHASATQWLPGSIPNSIATSPTVADTTRSSTAIREAGLAWSVSRAGEAEPRSHGPLPGDVHPDQCQRRVHRI